MKNARSLDRYQQLAFIQAMLSFVFLLLSFTLAAQATYVIGPPENSFDQVMRNYLELQAELDAVVPNRNHQVGHIGWLNAQSMYVWNLAHQPTVKRVCEVGFGNGFSSTNFLTAGNATMISFDLFPQPNQNMANTDQGTFMKFMPLSQTAGRKFLERKFPGRFQARVGYSSDSVPKFIKENPGYICDLIYIDGSHRYEPTLGDIRNFKALANKDTVLLFDDLDWPEVKRAVEEATQKDKIMKPMIECIHGEVLVDGHFMRAGSPTLRREKIWCQTKYVF